MSAAAAVFGKLPAQGDFVWRGMDATTRAAWDRFASDGLARAEQRLGAGFAAAHEAAAPWGFRLPPQSGLCSGWGVGVLLASVDRVGRRFVLTVMAEAVAPMDAERLGGAVSERMGEIALSAFTQGRDADALFAAASDAIASIGLNADGWPMEGLDEAWWPSGTDANRAPLRGDGSGARAFDALFAPAGLEGSW